MEGELKWEVENKSVRGFQVAENNKGLLVYLGSSIKPTIRMRNSMGYTSMAMERALMSNCLPN